MEPTYFRLIVLLIPLVLLALVVAKWPKSGLTLIGIGILAALGLYFVAQPRVRVVGPTIIATPQAPLAPLPAMPPMTAIPDNAIDVPVPATLPTTQISGKPWVDNWEAFVNSSRQPQRWVRAGTTLTYATEAEARAEARRQASVILGPTMLSVVRSDRRSLPGSSIVINDKWIREQLETSLNQNQLIADEFVQRTERPYGDVWKCELLIDTAPDKLAGIARTYQAAAQRKVTVTATSWGGLCLLTLVIILLYAFLNAATKGYFAWRLRAAAFMVVIVALLVVMAVV